MYIFSRGGNTECVLSSYSLILRWSDRVLPFRRSSLKISSLSFTNSLFVLTLYVLILLPLRARYRSSLRVEEFRHLTKSFQELYSYTSETLNIYFCRVGSEWTFPGSHNQCTFIHTILYHIYCTYNYRDNIIYLIYLIHFSYSAIFFTIKCICKLNQNIQKRGL